MQKKVLITGAAGFVGHHLVEHILKNTDWNITTIDRLDTSGNLNRLADMGEWQKGRRRIHVVYHDLKAEVSESVARMLGGPFDYIIHLAAGSHVDRSIEDPLLFFQDNCIGTVNLLNYARNGGLKPTGGKPARGKPAFKGKFQYFSTDEVFGPAPEGMSYKEWDRHNPNNPYAGSKSAAEMACVSFGHTYRMPIFITNVMNIFGERQHREKFIPLVMRRLLNGEKLTVHADHSRKKAGKRHYLHARNISAATVWLLENGKLLDGSATQGRYNIVGELEIDNLSLAKLVTRFVNEYRKEKGERAKSLKYQLSDFQMSRPGHDLRYALDGTLLSNEGFSYPVAFEESLRKVVRWTLDHPQWL